MKLSELKKAIKFNKMEDSFAVMQENGIYRQGDLYEQNGVIFCKKGTGFLKIYDTGHTSKEGIHCVGINIKGKKWKVGRFGMLEITK